jgi:hypothetical protein
VTEHAAEYVRTRTPDGTLGRNVNLVEEALRKREEDGWRLVSAVGETHNGDTTGVLLLFVRDQ